MLTAYYVHRLPADYDLDIIHARVRERGKLWDDVPDLFFKGFLLREAGRHGATENNYASLYLWRHDQAFRDFMTTGHYRPVTQSFGRAPIQARIALAARKGSAQTARFVHMEEVAIPADADLEKTLAREIELNHHAAARSGTLAAVASLDVAHWRLSRILLSENEVEGTGKEGRDAGITYRILHLARPLLHTLDSGAE